MKNSLWSSLTVAGLSVLLAGCIEHHATVHKSVERVRVQFENEAAGRVFYEKLSKLPSRDHKETKTQFCIPVVFDYERTVVADDNEKFNDAVRQADTNGDGIITETEAKIFANRP